MVGEAYKSQLERESERPSIVGLLKGTASLFILFSFAMNELASWAHKYGAICTLLVQGHINL